MPSHYVTNYGLTTPQNGVRVPAKDGLCELAWKACDKMTQMVDGKPQVPTVEAVIASGFAKKLNKGNVRTEYSYWKRFNGF